MLAALGLDQLVDASGQAFEAHGPDTAFDGAIVVDEGKGRLARNAERSPDLKVGIGDVIKATNFSANDPVLHRRDVIATGNTNDGDIFCKQLLNLCDRRGFSGAGRSPGRPEPQHHVLTLE
jgi:hypothetical protein